MAKIKDALIAIQDRQREVEEDNLRRYCKAKEQGDIKLYEEFLKQSDAIEIENLIKDYVKLDTLKPVISDYYKLLKDTVEKLQAKIGLGNFKDSDGVIYEIVKAEGRFVFFDQYQVNRTKKIDEVRGSLSQSRALEFGFSEEVGEILFNKVFKG